MPKKNRGWLERIGDRLVRFGLKCGGKVPPKPRKPRKTRIGYNPNKGK